MARDKGKDTEKTLEDLFVHTLRDVYYAEKQILRALPRIAKVSRTDELRHALERHRDETEAQIERLDKVFEQLGQKARGVPCEGINGIIEEGKEVIDDFKGSEALEAGLIAACQAIEHYEITRYGALKAWAEQLEMKEAVKLLDQTLREERKADETLSRLAERQANPKAA